MKRCSILDTGFWWVLSLVMWARVVVAQADGLALQPATPAPGNADALATLVVFNEKDAESGLLAKFYAEKRGVPKEQVIGLQCSSGEEISREEYDRTIAEPLRRVFTTNLFWSLRTTPDDPRGAVERNKIRFIALMRGIPLKIAQTEKYAGDQIGPAPVGTTNSAAVDSELALLGFHTRIISGALNNPYYRSYSPIADAGRPELMLVCRLDGPSPAIVRRMILDGLAAEQEGLAGFGYVDARGITEGGLLEGDQWLLGAAAALRKGGMPVVLDNGPDMFPDGYPMRNAAVYYGWYTDHAGDPFTRQGFRFVRGAVAVHIHSFSGITVRDAQRHWVGPLLAAGAAITLGNVYEPYLGLTPHIDIFQDRLNSGLTFAEAAYMSTRTLSWMTTFVGDPLYRPFKGADFNDQRPATGEWAAYRESSKLWFSKDRARAVAALEAAGKKYKSGMIFEGLGLLELTVNDRAGAIADFQQARQLYSDPEDITRAAIHEIIQLRGLRRSPEALALTRKMRKEFPQIPAAAVLKLFDEQPVAEPPPGPTR
jgi:uncharacterized protein (TIGR03790 family)